MNDKKVKSSPARPPLAAAVPGLPRAAGVYLFKDDAGRVLYVGKATNLKNRVASYLKAPGQLDPKTSLLMAQAVQVDYLLTTTPREALILERNLIKKHTPRYNVRLRDDKNYLCLRLDPKEDFPALRFVRRFAPDGAWYFGPYTVGGAARETVKVMKQVFGLRTCKERRLTPRSRPCLEGQMGRCLAPCAGRISREEYRRVVQEAAQFLRGRGRGLLRTLKMEMEQAAAALDFERAARLRDRLEAVRRTLERQDMARPTFKDQDVIGVALDDAHALVLVLLVRGGLVSGSREYYFPEIPGGGDLLGDFLSQYYTEERLLPDEILLPWAPPEIKLLAAGFEEQQGKSVRIWWSDRKGEEADPSSGKAAAALSQRRRLLALAQENARAALARRAQAPRRGDPLQDLQERLGLPTLPSHLECLDISTLQGRQPVGALAVFREGRPEKSEYRRFRIREVAGQDDYAMLREVVSRSFGREGRELPDLLVVDGGKGQLRVVLETLKDLGLPEFPVVGLAKEAARAEGEVPDRLFLPGRKNPKFLPAGAPGWLLLLRLRDEAHRFAVRYHRRRARQELVTSILTQVPGIGPVRRQRLLSHFQDWQELRRATPQELAAAGGFPLKLAEHLKEFLSGLADTDG